MLLVGESGPFLPLLIIKHPLPPECSKVLEAGVAPVLPGPVTGVTWGLSESLSLPFPLPQDQGTLGLQPLVVPNTSGAPPRNSLALTFNASYCGSHQLGAGVTRGPLSDSAP